MAHYAFLDDNNLVTEVIVGRDEDDLANGVTSWEDYYGAFRGQRCLRTSYNTQGGVYYATDEDYNRFPPQDQTKAFRGNYAGVGYTYDEALDAFIAPQPFPSWFLNEETFTWEAPTPYPSDGKRYIWDESAGAWVEVEDEAV
jgi:hypothetical protein